MKDIAVLMACWRSPELLRVSIPSLIKSMSTNSEIIIILNEPDDESVGYLESMGIQFINNESNCGPSAVDYAIPFIENKFKYVANVNSDMIFSTGWDMELIKLLEINKPCTVSCCLVEPIHNGHSIYENLGDFLNDGNHEKFNNNLLMGKYKTEESISYNHPILCTIEDFLSVNGYSDNMKQEWVDLKGRGLDDDFIYRLYKKYEGNIKYLKSNKAYVYHGISLNSKKLVNRQGGADVFKTLNGIEINDFRKMIKYI